MNPLGFAVFDRLWRRHVGMQLDLVDSRNDRGRWVIQKLFKVADDEVGDTDVLDLTSFNKLLHFFPIMRSVRFSRLTLRLNYPTRCPGMSSHHSASSNPRERLN